MENRFSKAFDDYACPGDTIHASIDGFDITARIEFDQDSHIDDDDCHNTDQSVTGCTDEGFAKLLKARKAWFNDEWFYCGIVLSVSRLGVMLDNHAAALWSIDCNYPKECTGLEDGSPNDYLTEVANELLDEALESGKAIMEKLCHAG